MDLSHLPGRRTLLDIILGLLVRLQEIVGDKNNHHTRGFMYMQENQVTSRIVREKAGGLPEQRGLIH